MSDRPLIPNAVLDDVTQNPLDPDAPIQAPDIEDRREAMKDFHGTEPAVQVPLAGALASNPDAGLSETGRSSNEDTE